MAAPWAASWAKSGDLACCRDRAREARFEHKATLRRLEAAGFVAAANPAFAGDRAGGVFMIRSQCYLTPLEDAEKAAEVALLKAQLAKLAAQMSAMRVEMEPQAAAAKEAELVRLRALLANQLIAPPIVLQRQNTRRDFGPVQSA